MHVCFRYRSSGSSVTVKLNQNPLGGISTKFKAGIIFAENKYAFDGVGESGNVYCIITSKQNAPYVCLSGTKH